MKKLSMFMLAMVMIVALFAGCSKPNESANNNETANTDTNTPAPAPAPKKEVQELTLMMHGSWYKEGWEAIEKDINARQEELGFKLKVEKIPEGEQGTQLIQVRFAANDMPDFLLWSNAARATTQIGDHFEDISGDWVKHYREDMIKGSDFSYDGKVIAAPVGSSILIGTFYNEKVFDEHGLEIPTTFEELVETAKKAEEAGLIPVYMSGADAWTNQFYLTAAVVRGGDMVDIADKLYTNQFKLAEHDEFVTAMKNHRALIEMSLVNEDWLADNYDSAQKALAEGEAAMYMLGTWVITEIASKYPEEIVNQIRAFPNPYDGNNEVVAQVPPALYMTKGIKDKELGKEFIEYIAGEQGQKIYFDAQAGIPQFIGLDTDMYPAMKDLYDAYMENGDLYIQTKYSWGPSSNHLDMLIGAISPEDYAKKMDDEIAKNAKAAGDSNWK